jgi:hypothetical protein
MRARGATGPASNTTTWWMTDTDAAWEGDMARAAALDTRITALDPELDHQRVVPF